MNKENASKNFFKLLEIVEQLRGPDGCDWDKKQTAESLLPYFLEETYEVIESVDNKNWENFQEELGDVLLHVVLQSQIAHEENKFSNNLLTRFPSWKCQQIMDLCLSQDKLESKPVNEFMDLFAIN